MSTSRASCCSTRLSWALVLAKVSHFVQNEKGWVWVRERISFLALTFAQKEHYCPVLTRVKNGGFESAKFL